MVIFANQIKQITHSRSIAFVRIDQRIICQEFVRKYCLKFHRTKFYVRSLSDHPPLKRNLRARHHNLTRTIRFIPSISINSSISGPKNPRSEIIIKLSTVIFAFTEKVWRIMNYLKNWMNGVLTVQNAWNFVYWISLAVEAHLHANVQMDVRQCFAILYEVFHKSTSLSLFENGRVCHRFFFWR